MALIAIAAAEIAFDVGLTIYRALTAPKQPLPPLRDLQYMSATNGAPLPFGYGTCRVAGNVIWTPGITYVKSTKKSNAGINIGPKGSFIFTASVAVSFGEGPGTINRIWADSKLIYDANPSQSTAVPPTDWPAWDSTVLYDPGNQVNDNGQVWQALLTNINSEPSQSNRNWEIISPYPPWDSGTEYLAGDIVTYNGELWLAQVASNNGDVGAFTPGNGNTVSVGGENVLYWIALTAIYPPPTMYPGDQAQLPDSLIQASEGSELTPGYRGQIYCVWEGLQLINFANRIPNFRAEITYSKTSNLLANPPGPAIVKGSSPLTLPVTSPGDTIVILLHGDSSSGSPPSDSQGNTYTSGAGAGPEGVEDAWTDLLYAYSQGGANTISFAGSAVILILPGTWTFDYGSGGGFAEDTPGTSGTQQMRSTLATGEFYIAGIRYLYTHGLPDPEVQISGPDGQTDTDYPFAFIYGFLGAPGFYTLETSWTYDTLDSLPLFNGEGLAGAWATFKPPAVISVSPPQTPIPDVLHDICERAGLDEDQIDNSLITGNNIFAPLSPSTTVMGYLVEKPTPAASILKPLMLAYFFDACETDGTIKFVPRGLPAALTVPEADLGLLADMCKIIEQISQEQDLPKQFTVNFNDPLLDYQKNKQLKQRNTRIINTRQQQMIELPMTMTPDWAMQVAAKALYLAWLERSSYKFNLWRASYLLLDPTDVIEFVYEALTFSMRVKDSSVGANLATALQGISELAELFESSLTGGATLAGGGPGEGNPLQATAPTMWWLFDIPLLQDVDSNPENTGFYFAMSSALATWSGGILYDSTDDSNFVQEGASAQPATFGVANNILAAPARSPWTWDRVNTLTVNLSRGSFASDTPINVLNGSNAILVGSELVQFTTAVQNADGSWKLSGLLRGRRGTEWACSTHVAGELVLMPSTGIQRIQLPLAVVNQPTWYKGVTAGQDPATVTPREFIIIGRDLMPYAPCHVAGSRDMSGNLTIDWVRRTRVGWRSLSQDPVPLSEDAEEYSIDILDSMGHVKRTITSTSPTASYSAANQTTDFGSAQAAIAMNVYQVSAQVGRGFAAAATV